jgi:membrane associated rhomboid family serine protease
VGTGGPDLFVICKSCGSEVSPYITECPYCGNRLRKRAPKLDRNGRLAERLGRRQPAQLSRLRRGEIPGIRHDTHPYATIVLVVLGVAGCLVLPAKAVSLYQVAVQRPLGNHAWRVLTAPFIYNNIGYAFVALTATALYGTLLERRHGPFAVLALFLLGAVGGAALASQANTELALGGVGGALALLVAWAMPDLMALGDGKEIEGDLLGTAVFAAVLVLMPLAVTDASWISVATGVLVGALVGYPLARVHPG